MHEDPATAHQDLNHRTAPGNTIKWTATFSTVKPALPTVRRAAGRRRTRAAAVAIVALPAVAVLALVFTASPAFAAWPDALDANPFSTAAPAAAFPRSAATSPHPATTFPHPAATSPHPVATSPHPVATSPHPAATAPSPPATPQDVAATHAYLEAVRTELQAAVASLPVAKTDVERLLNAIGRECPNVLKGAPVGEFEVGPQAKTNQLTASRERRQLGRLQAEAITALAVTWETPQRPALLAFAHSVAALQWSSATLTAAVHAQAARFEERATKSVPTVCADAQAWVASGYSTLSAGTKAFVKQMTAERQARRDSPPVGPLLAPSERGEKALLAQIEKLTHTQDGSLTTLLTGPEGQLERSLGLQVPPRRLGELLGRQPKGSVVIARGRTAAGERYVARLQRAPRGSGHVHVCAQLSISHGGRDSYGTSVCRSGSPRPSEASVTCNAARLTITAQTLPGARSVRLRLSSGRQITTPVLLVPKRLGGPAGYYYQVVRGPSPIPVSLTELNAQGRAVRTVRLPRIVECTRNPLKYLPGGKRTLVHETAPNGPTFSIVGERYRFLGKVYFEVKLNVDESPPQEEGEGRLVTSGESLGTIYLGHVVFKPQIETGCRPQPYTIVYGLLKQTGDTVSVGTAPAALTPLRAVPIAADLHAGGVLVYAVLPGAPERLEVHAPGGKVVQNQKLELGSFVGECERMATERKEEAEEEA